MTSSAEQFLAGFGIFADRGLCYRQAGAVGAWMVAAGGARERAGAGLPVRRRRRARSRNRTRAAGERPGPPEGGGPGRSAFRGGALLLRRDGTRLGGADRPRVERGPLARWPCSRGPIGDTRPMCGIAGIVGVPAPDQDVLTRMAQAMIHRGPDDQGIWRDGSAGLAFRRLAIIDLDPRSNQPLHHDGLHLVFNGEIYNYRELRSELQASGHAFVTEGDGEVLIHAWREWGEAALDSRQRDVRHGRLGRARRLADAGIGPVRREAALLLRSAGAVGVRLRHPRAHRGRGRPRRAGRGGPYRRSWPAT